MNRVKNSKTDILFNVIMGLILTLIILVELYPLVYAVSASLSDPMKVVNGEVWLFPKGFSTDSYIKVINNADVWTGFRNTVIYTTLNVVISIILTMLVAYPLSRKDLKGRGFIMKLLVFTMFFQGGMIPTYLVVSKLGLVNSMWSVILLMAVNTYNIIVTKTFLENSIPYELYESAHIDGCSNTRMLFSIVVPLSKPILAVMILFYAVAQWNDFFNALLYLTNKERYPLQLVLRTILTAAQYSSGGDDVGALKRLMDIEQLKYAAIIITSIPMFLIYPFAQKYFVKGVMIGAVKG